MVMGKAGCAVVGGERCGKGVLQNVRSMRQWEVRGGVCSSGGRGGCVNEG